MTHSLAHDLRLERLNRAINQDDMILDLDSIEKQAAGLKDMIEKFNKWNPSDPFEDCIDFLTDMLAEVEKKRTRREEQIRDQ